MSIFSRFACARVTHSPRQTGRFLQILFLALVACTLTQPTMGHAFELLKDSKGKVLRWTNPVVRIGVNPNNAGSVPVADVEKVFQKAIANWNSVKCSNFVGIYVKVAAFANGTDKQNVISFPPNFAGGNIFQSGFRSDNNGGLTDVDVSLNPQAGWTLNPSGGGQDLESIAMAVVGTVLGLGSSTEPKATMGGNFLAGDISKRTLHPDDIAGICTLYPSGQAECAGDADCPSGLGCTAAKCVEKAPTPNPKSCKPCATDSDCGSPDLVCDLVGNGRHCLHKCTPDGLCPSGTACSGNGVGAQCLPTTGSCPKSSCTNDADCGAGFKCKAGACAPECSQDADCTAPNVCNNGKCGPKGGCRQDLDCQAGWLCKAGQCVENTTKQPCTNDNDCPNLFSCKNKFCERDPTGNCTDGQTQACKCSDGKAGTQTCAGGQFGACAGCSGGPGVCTAGATQACACAGGASGKQTCKADGSAWGACEGCGGTPTCAAGSTQACVCTDGKSGAQTCAADGSKWEACTCTGSGNLCAAGATQACVCTDGKSGTQACATDGKSWGTCEGCGGGNPGVCTAGASQACVCSDGTNGTQSCNADGSAWGICICEAGPPGENPNTPDGGVTPPPPQACKTHSECPTGNFCVQNVCRASGSDKGCDCSSASPLQGGIPFLLVTLFLLGLSIQRRRIQR